MVSNKNHCLNLGAKIQLLKTGRVHTYQTKLLRTNLSNDFARTNFVKNKFVQKVLGQKFLRTMTWDKLRFLPSFRFYLEVGQNRALCWSLGDAIACVNSYILQSSAYHRQFRPDYNFDLIRIRGRARINPIKFPSCLQKSTKYQIKN